ncbi:hypothetical protein ACTFIU_010648 [Dictyostelium citrinum]
MVLQYPEFNAFSPTPGQKLILNAIGRTQLPFEAIKKIKTIKGKDLLWRFVLKALPKVYNTICSHCNVRESAENIFFKCKSHLQTTQLILDHIQNKIGGQKIIWNIKILNHLDIAITENTIALLFEYIWRKRNKFNHEKIIQIIHKEQIINELKKTQEAKKKKNSTKSYQITWKNSANSGTLH